MANVFCIVCRNVAELKTFKSEISDYVLTCGHLYYAETEDN